MKIPVFWSTIVVVVIEDSTVNLGQFCLYTHVPVCDLQHPISVVLPLPPEEFSIKRISETQIDLDWKSPGGPNITGFVVEKATQLWAFDQVGSMENV